VKEFLKKDPFSGHLFLFVNRYRTVEWTPKTGVI
jgi:hypothetical protein